MPRSTLPAYRHHKPSGQAVVTLSGRDMYLGPHGTKLSRDQYDRVVGEWLAAGRAAPQRDIDAAHSVTSLCAAFVTAGQVPDTHRHEYKTVIKLLNRLYGRTPANDYRPLALQATRQRWIDEGLKRSTINDRVNKVRRIFRWGVEKELVGVLTLNALDAVESLRLGKSEAPDSTPVEPVEADRVTSLLDGMPPMVAAMVQLQMLTGMRAKEMCMMRTCDIDTSGQVWVYRPSTHKTANKGKSREVAIGPKAIEHLQPWLLPDLQAFIFTPERSELVRRAKIHAERRTPLSCGNRPGKRSPSGRPPGTRARKFAPRYTTVTYRQAITRVIEAAFPPPPRLARARGETKQVWRLRLGPDLWAELKLHEKLHRWTPHQLRHAFATVVGNQFTAEHAMKALGHSNLKATQIYAKLSLDKAKEVARAIG